MVRLSLLTAAAGSIAYVSAAYADAFACLGAREARAAITNGRAAALVDVKRFVERAHGAEILRAQLCEADGRLAYVLTLLRRDGQVVGVAVDALSGGSSSVASGQSRTDRRELAIVPGRD